MLRPDGKCNSLLSDMNSLSKRDFPHSLAPATPATNAASTVVSTAAPTANSASPNAAASPEAPVPRHVQVSNVRSPQTKMPRSESRKKLSLAALAAPYSSEELAATAKPTPNNAAAHTGDSDFADNSGFMDGNATYATADVEDGPDTTITPLPAGNNATLSFKGGIRPNNHPKKELCENIKHGTSVFPFASYLWVPQNYPSRVMLHWHREMELVRFTHGIFKVSVDMQDLVVKDDAFMLLPGNVMHTISLPSQCEESAIVFDPKMLLMQNYDEVQSEIFEALISGNMPLPPIITPEHPAFASIDALYQYCSIHGATSSAAGRLIIKAKLLEILSIYHKFGLISRKEVPNEVKRSKQDKLKELLNYIDSHYAGPMTIKDASQRLGVTDQYFCRFFKRVTAMSFTEYLNDLRLRRAAKEIELTSRSISDIAYDHGFENAGYFFKSFKLKYGITPLKYRKRFLQEQAQLAGESTGSKRRQKKNAAANPLSVPASGNITMTPNGTGTEAAPSAATAALFGDAAIAAAEHTAADVADNAELELAGSGTPEQQSVFRGEANNGFTYMSTPHLSAADAKSAQLFSADTVTVNSRQAALPERKVAQPQRAPLTRPLNKQIPLPSSQFALINPMHPPLNQDQVAYLSYLHSIGFYSFDPNDYLEGSVFADHPLTPRLAQVADPNRPTGPEVMLGRPDTRLSPEDAADIEQVEEDYERQHGLSPRRYKRNDTSQYDSTDSAAAGVHRASAPNLGGNSQPFTRNKRNSSADYAYRATTPTTARHGTSGLSPSAAANPRAPGAMRSQGSSVQLDDGDDDGGARLGSVTSNTTAAATPAPTAHPVITDRADSTDTTASTATTTAAPTVTRQQITQARVAAKEAFAKAAAEDKAAKKAAAKAQSAQEKADARIKKVIDKAQAKAAKTMAKAQNDIAAFQAKAQGEVAAAQDDAQKAAQEATLAAQKAMDAAQEAAEAHAAVQAILDAAGDSASWDDSAFGEDYDYNQLVAATEQAPKPARQKKTAPQGNAAKNTASASKTLSNAANRDNDAERHYAQQAQEREYKRLEAVKTAAQAAVHAMRNLKDNVPDLQIVAAAAAVAGGSTAEAILAENDEAQQAAATAFATAKAAAQALNVSNHLVGQTFEDSAEVAERRRSGVHVISGRSEEESDAADAAGGADDDNDASQAAADQKQSPVDDGSKAKPNAVKKEVAPVKAVVKAAQARKNKTGAPKSRAEIRAKIDDLKTKQQYDDLDV